ncbi:MAG: UDP-N-acetylmuramate dehydrogenase [Desulfobacterales bacterium]|jgi:UDP-N-acetylmuramate dehydrogenase
MSIQENISLKPFNTFAVEARARWFLSVTAPDGLAEALAKAPPGRPLLVLGAGSNILFTRDFQGLVLKNDIRGREVVDQDRDRVLVRAGGGEDWHGFVQWCLRHRLYGLENLALIPGTVGAAPVQNIGAYGVEVGERIEAVEAIDLQSGAACRFDARACDFAYRHSMFKDGGPNRFLITAVTFRLHQQPRPVISYADVRRALADRKRPNITPSELSDLICTIRRRKLPDPEELPNAGSFFKNPVIAPTRYRALQDRFPGLPAYPIDDQRVKIAAGWMIERCGWKGRRRGACGVFARQALVLVNYGGATGRDVLALAQAVQASVEERFAIRLEPEPLIL